MGYVQITPKPHRCDLPVEPAYTDFPEITRPAVGSVDDLWKCDTCGQHWTPEPLMFPFHSHWVRLDGWKLRRRLRKIRRAQPTPEGGR